MAAGGHRWLGRRELTRWIAVAALPVLLASDLRQEATHLPSPAQLRVMQQKHLGRAGALDPINLDRPRPKPPFDLTGTWFIDLSQGAKNLLFGPPYPEFLDAGKKAWAESAAARASGQAYRDSIGQCYPAGMPMIMTRDSPIMFIQKPTAIYMVAGFANSFRTIFLDGRTHTDPDLYAPTYNGESIGHWEGATLVIDTRGFETDHHWIDFGIPVSKDLQIVERIRMTNGGNALEIEFVMTDPNLWKGVWRTTKRWDRVPESDIAENECSEARDVNLPGTDRGQRAIDARGGRSKSTGPM